MIPNAKVPLLMPGGTLTLPWRLWAAGLEGGTPTPTPPSGGTVTSVTAAAPLLSGGDITTVGTISAVVTGTPATGDVLITAAQTAARIWMGV